MILSDGWYYDDVNGLLLTYDEYRNAQKRYNSLSEQTKIKISVDKSKNVKHNNSDGKHEKDK